MTNLQEEIWKAIPGYEGYYEASNMGRVRSIKRSFIRADGKFKTFQSKILSQGIDKKSGYHNCNLSKGGKHQSIRVHRLVMMAFNGISKLTVDHRNTIRSDNRLSNLRYCTQRQNNTFRFENDKSKSSKYVGVHWHKGRGRWESQIMINKRIKHLGGFETERKAYLAYQRELKLIA